MVPFSPPGLGILAQPSKHIGSSQRGTWKADQAQCWREGGQSFCF